MLTEIEKRTKALAKAAKGLNFNVSCYEGAASLEDALELYFKSLNRDLKELLEVHKFSAIAGVAKKKISKSALVGKLVNFYVETATLLNTYIEDFSALAKAHGLQTVEQKEKLQRKKLEFGSMLEARFAELREDAKNHISIIEKLSLETAIDPKIIQALRVWGKLTFATFFNMAKSGNILWLPDDK